uniref:uncharacterized protein n=1 Tax=Pristiophorus japonicus TaxID=55135 RepID=UPI00398ED6B0
EGQSAAAPSGLAGREEEPDWEEARVSGQQEAENVPGAGRPERQRPAGNWRDEEGLAEDDGFEEGPEFDGSPRGPEPAGPVGGQPPEEEAEGQGAGGSQVGAGPVEREGPTSAQQDSAEALLAPEKSLGLRQTEPEVHTPGLEPQPQPPPQTHGSSQRELQDQLESVQQENASLRSVLSMLNQEKSELARSMMAMQEKELSTSRLATNLQHEVESLRTSTVVVDDSGKQSYCIMEASLHERVSAAENDAEMARAQLATLLEKFKRVDRDNQMMADEIHVFREEIGRLRQCHPAHRSYQTKFATLALVFVLGVFYYWFLSEDYVTP